LNVTDGTNTYTSPAYTIQVIGTAAGAATLTWTPPTTYTDGSPLTVAGYKVHWGMSPGQYPNTKSLPAGVASDVITPLGSGTWYFVVTALDSGNVESAFSNMAQKTL
jgi:hypothetical protein